jgi:tol-pal system protein YbgF
MKFWRRVFALAVVGGTLVSSSGCTGLTYGQRVISDHKVAERRDDDAAKRLVVVATSGARRKTPRNEILALIQAELMALGYSVGPADGIMGRRTRGGIRAFQQRRRLPVNTEASSELLRAVFTARSFAGGLDSRGPRPMTELKEPGDPSFGSYHALVIGNNEYSHSIDLKTAASDARAVRDILVEAYGFKVELLIDATRGDIVSALSRYRSKLSSKDNFLIYYAGHGFHDREANEGYWLPVDARLDENTQWIANSTITASLRAIDAKHAIVIADSCYSGTLTRGVSVEVNSPESVGRLLSRRSRIVISSGGDEPVIDAGGDGHSVFARALLDALSANKNILGSLDLYQRIRRPVMLESEQAPQYGNIRKARHEDGEFFFRRIGTLTASNFERLRLPSALGAIEWTDAPVTSQGGFATSRPREELARYQIALEARRSGQFSDCIEGFTNFLRAYPNSGYADDAAYWLAECTFKNGEFKRAVVRFNSVVSVYPESPKAPDALYRQGESLLKLGSKFHRAARTVFRRVQKRYPESARSIEAARQLNRLR